MENLDLVFGYILALNVISFIIVGYDKRRTVKDKWRIPEKRFFTFAFLGGALGVYLGMKHFRHKTLHKHFVYLIPLIIILNIVLFYFVIFNVLPFIEDQFKNLI